MKGPGRPLKYTAFLEELEDAEIYNSGAIVNHSSHLLKEVGTKRSAERTRIRHTLNRLRISRDFPENGDGMVHSAGMAPQIGWFGWRWKRAVKGDCQPGTPVEVSTTHRGFVLSEFKDLYGTECSIQKSSLATADAIWLGCDDPNPKQLVPGQGWQPFNLPADTMCTTRMHLNREMVGKLLPVLQHFYVTGELPG